MDVKARPVVRRDAHKGGLDVRDLCVSLDRQTSHRINHDAGNSPVAPASIATGRMLGSYGDSLVLECAPSAKLASFEAWVAVIARIGNRIPSAAAARSSVPNVDPRLVCRSGLAKKRDVLPFDTGSRQRHRRPIVRRRITECGHAPLI